VAAAAYPSFHVTGAVHHYIGWAGIDPLYLGTAESTPQIKFVETSKPVMNDITGPNLPAQKVETGEMATIAVAFNRFSQSTRNSLFTRAGLPRRSRFSRGLLKYGRSTFYLWQVFENATDATVRALYPNLPLGFFWPQVELVMKDGARLGNQDELWVATFEAQPYFVPQASPTQVAVGEREFWLYAQDDASFPAAVQVPQ
jgi:hypothetical protein